MSGSFTDVEVDESSPVAEVSVRIKLTSPFASVVPEINPLSVPALVAGIAVTPLVKVALEPE